MKNYLYFVIPVIIALLVIAGSLLWQLNKVFITYQEQVAGVATEKAAR